MKATKVEVHSLEERIKYISEHIREGREDPDVREFVMQVVNEKCGDKWCVGEKDNDAEIIAVFDAVRKTVRYVRDPVSADTYSAPKHTLRLHGGDCDDYSVLLGAALGAIGYPVKLRVIWSKGSEDWNHIYVLVGLPPEHPDKWVPLDASVDKPAGWEVPSSEVVRFKDFEVD
jgi:transglutaminase-like putative cysteine protease